MATFKEDYFDGATGFHQQMADCFAAGEAFIVANAALITAGLQSAAASGKKTFTINLVTVDNPSYLRLNGTYAQTYLNGISQALADGEIYSYECTPVLNLSDSVSVSINLNFTF